MPFNVQQFKSNYGFPARADKFEMMITSPLALGGQTNPSELNLKVEATEMPGRSALTGDHKHYGALRKIPYSVNYLDVSATVLVSEDYREVEYFNAWQDLIVGSHRNYNIGLSDYFNVGYYEEFVSPAVDIRVFDQNNPTPRKVVRLVEAFPLTINPISYNWGSQEVVKLQVQFAYRYYQTLDTMATSLTRPNNTITITSLDQLVQLLKKKAKDKIIDEVRDRARDAFGNFF